MLMNSQSCCEPGAPNIETNAIIVYFRGVSQPHTALMPENMY